MKNYAKVGGRRKGSGSGRVAYRTPSSFRAKKSLGARIVKGRSSLKKNYDQKDWK